MRNIFRLVALLEGVSYILLLFIAVPLKYWGDNESFVKLLGMPHGILFVSYIAIAFLMQFEKEFDIQIAKIKGSKNYKRIIALGICLVITFVWGMLITIIGLDAKSQGIIQLICYLILVGFIWKRIVNENNLNIPIKLIILIASIIPFGTFYVDWKYLRN